MPYNIEYYMPPDDNVHIFWCYFNDNDRNGVRYETTLKDVILRCKNLMNEDTSIFNITLHDDNSSCFRGKISRF